ncbi:MAG: PIN domain-containing protein [Anaerolineae bacterium]|nr:PIN domain-containing protein [Anaerolineae bacterium]
MRGLDTNIIIRYLTRDDEAKAGRCPELLRRAERGEEELFLPEAILTEAVYVLSSPRLYNLPRGRVRDLLAAVVSLRGVRMPDKAVCLEALELYGESNLDFEDALLVTHLRAQGVGALYSYDRHFDHSELERLEP